MDIIIFLLRITVAVLCVIEGCTQFRTLPLLGVILFDTCRTCLQALSMENFDKNCLQKWREFSILFKLGNEYASTMLTVVLGSLFYLLVLCYTVAILAPGRVSWTIYMFIPTFGIIISTIISIALYLLVNVSEDSKRLKILWRRSCAVIAGDNISTTRILWRQIKCMHHVEFSYSSLGTVTKATRTDYIYTRLFVIHQILF